MIGLTRALFAAALSLFAAAPGEPPPQPGIVPAKPEAEVVKPAAEAAAPVSKREWTVAKHLEVAGQPTTAETAKIGDEAYRFIMTDAGLTSSTIVLVYRKGSDYFLKSAEVHLHDYYGSAGKEGVEKTERKLTADQWNGLKVKLDALDFWKTPEPERRLVLDGTIWTIDGASAGKTRTLSIHAPEAGAFRAAGLYLWRLSGSFMGFWADKQE